MTWKALPPEISLIRELRFLGNGKRAEVLLTLPSGLVLSFACSDASIEVVGRVQSAIAPWDDDSLDIRYRALHLHLDGLECAYSEGMDPKSDAEFAKEWDAWVAKLPAWIAQSPPPRRIERPAYVLKMRARLRGD
jgi:hypothetical protein